MVFKLTWKGVGAVIAALGTTVAIWFAIGLPGPAFTSHIQDVKRDLEIVRTDTKQKLTILEEKTDAKIEQAAELGRSAWLVILYQKRSNAEAKRDRAEKRLESDPNDVRAQLHLKEAYQEIGELNRQINQHERTAGSTTSR